MPGRRHAYTLHLRWTGNTGGGTATYAGYARDHLIEAAGKVVPIHGSADAAFCGDAHRWNPEELLLAAVCACHQLSYLALCARAGLSVLSYEDAAEGVMEETGLGGRFTSVTLRPRVVVGKAADCPQAERLHHDAHESCYIAGSVNFPVFCKPVIRAAELM